MGDEQTPVDLLSTTGTGPVWGMASNDLNATLLAWLPGHDVAEHTNAELDVLLVVLEGSGVVTVDREERALAPGHLLLLERGSLRAIRSGPEGLRYLSVHRRRGPLQVAPMPPQR
jgi:quercetin dioxygenase-like cupin family protein